MAREVITAADVAQAPAGDLVVSAGAIITPLARDVARERGVRLVEGGTVGSPGAGPVVPGGGASELEQRVRALVAAVLAEDGSAAERGGPGARGVKLVQGRDVTLEPFPFPGPGPDQRVHAADVVTSEDGSPMGAGYLTLTAGSFPWTLTYDEVQIVLEGELHIGTAQGTRIGRPGDILYGPMGSAITFGTPTWARFVYVTFPADWAG